MDCSLAGSSVHRILQAGTLEWAAISLSRLTNYSFPFMNILYVFNWTLYSFQFFHIQTILSSSPLQLLSCTHMQDFFTCIETKLLVWMIFSYLILIDIDKLCLKSIKLSHHQQYCLHIYTCSCHDLYRDWKHDHSNL